MIEMNLARQLVDDQAVAHDLNDTMCAGHRICAGKVLNAPLCASVLHSGAAICVPGGHLDGFADVQVDVTVGAGWGGRRLALPVRAPRDHSPTADRGGNDELQRPGQARMRRQSPSRQSQRKHQQVESSRYEFETDC